MGKPNLLVSFSSGRTSAYMAQWLINNKSNEYSIEVVFANTGKEREESLVFADKCDKHFGFNLWWLEAEVDHRPNKGTKARVVDFESASRNGEPFEDVIKKYGIPNYKFPHCTRELKRQPIQWFAKNIFGWKYYHTAIGIRTDEIDRMSDRMEQDKLIYPLVSMNPTSKKKVNRFWIGMPFDLQIKSYEGNCNKCWKKSFRKLMTIEAEEKGERDTWWEEMEEKYGAFRSNNVNRQTEMKQLTFYRNNLSAKDLQKMSKENFKPARDDSKDTDEQLDLFWDIDKPNGDCGESCEPF